MATERKFAICEVCGNFIGIIEEGKGKIICCGEPMKMLVANTTDAAKEKHVPVASVDGNKLTVTIGEIPHPMTDAHLIKWIMVAQGDRTQRQSLSSDKKPEAEFYVESAPFTVYEYCNLHGLWKLDVE